MLHRPKSNHSLAIQGVHQLFRPPRHKTSHAHPKVVSRPTTDTLNSSRHMLFRAAYKSDQILECFDFLSSSCEYLRGALSGSPFFCAKPAVERFARSSLFQLSGWVAEQDPGSANITVGYPGLGSHYQFAKRSSVRIAALKDKPVQLLVHLRLTSRQCHSR